MKVLFITFLCTYSLFLCAQQKDLLKKNAFVSGNVMDEKKNPISVHIDVIDNETKELIDQSESKSTGDFRIPVSQNNTYIIFISNPGYLFQSFIVSIPDTVKYEKKLDAITLQKVEVGKTTILNNLSFDFYHAIVLDESRPDLDRVIALLKDMPTVQIEISGFTDNIGSETLNKQLSEQWTKSVVDMLIKSGLDYTRMKYKGYGPAQPIATNFTEEGRQMNERIELKVLNLDLVIKKEADSKKKKGDLSLPVAIKQEDDSKDGEQRQVDMDTVLVANTQNRDSALVHSLDTLARIDYKGKFIADKSPLANSTVNLVTTTGEIFKSTKTDQNGAFEFLNIDADQEVTFGLDAKETKKYKKIALTDTTGVVIKELSKINGEFVLALLPSEKNKLGTVYMIDPPLKLKTKPKKSFIIGRVIDDKGYPIRVQIEVIENTTNQSVEKAQSNSDGRYNIPLPPGKNYDIVFNKSGYLFQSISVEMPDSAGYEKKLEDITLQKMEVGKKIVLNNIFFDSGESTLRKESFLELERAVKLIKDMVSLQIEISGHTDNVGASKSNRQLSEQRAKAVTDFLISKGCDENRLKYKGYGSGQPIASNNTEGGRQLNRRTEFKVLKIDFAAEQINKVEKMKEANATTDKKDGNPDATHEEQKNNNNNPIPEHFKKYDKDLNGIISYAEIIIAIDSFFENNPKAIENKKADGSISALLDYYFEQ